jgi:purine nucleosidase
MRVVVDTDTASDDALALLVAALSDRAELAAVTVVAGNAAFDRQVENALYTLELAGADVPVHPGAREPLETEREGAEYFHGEGGFAGFDPEPAGSPADEGAVDRIVRAARGDATALLCLGPLTNVALALRREPALPELLDLYAMAGACNTLGNVTPAAEFNAWVDPEAARLVLAEFEVTLVDWGVSVRDTVLPAPFLDDVAAADSPYADFFDRISARAREVTRESQGIDGLVQPDALTVVAALAPALVETERLYVDVDDREGMTRGYTLCDERGVCDRDPGTDLVRAADTERFRALIRATLLDGDPDAALE